MKKPTSWVWAYLAPFAIGIGILAGAGVVTGQSWYTDIFQFVWRDGSKSFDAPAPTPPFIVTSPAMVPLLNAEMVGGFHADDLQGQDGATGPAGDTGATGATGPTGAAANFTPVAPIAQTPGTGNWGVTPPTPIPTPYYKTDGTSTMTAEASFAEGARVPGMKSLKFGDTRYSYCQNQGWNLYCSTPYNPTPGADVDIILHPNLSGSPTSHTRKSGRVRIYGNAPPMVDTPRPALELGAEGDGVCELASHVPEYASGASHACGTFEFDRPVWLDYIAALSILKLDENGQVVAAVPDVDYLVTVPPTPTPIITGTPTPNDLAGFNAEGRIVSVPVPTPMDLAAFYADCTDGDAPDGDLIIDSDRTLTAGIHAASLTVNEGIRLKTANFPVFVRTDLINNGIIENNGNDAVGTTAGAATSAQTYRANVAGRFTVVVAPTPAACVSAGDGTGCCASTNGNAEGAGVGAAGATGAGGGRGGNCNDNSGYVGGAGYAGGTGGAATSIAKYGWINRLNLELGKYSAATTTLTAFGGNGGTGSSGWGGNGACCGIDANLTPGSRGTPGASGANGGYLYICARNIINNGTISSNGGAGSAALDSADAVCAVEPCSASATGAGASGGGCGGAGGIIALVYSTLTDNGTIQAVPGAAGAPGQASAGYGPAHAPGVEATPCPAGVNGIIKYLRM